MSVVAGWNEYRAWRREVRELARRDTVKWYRIRQSLKLGGTVEHIAEAEQLPVALIQYISDDQRRGHKAAP